MMPLVRWSALAGVLATLACCAPQMPPPPPRAAAIPRDPREASGPPASLPYNERQHPYYGPLPPDAGPRPHSRMRDREQARSNKDYDGDYRAVPHRRGAAETDYDLPDNILFALDSARISPRALPALREIARAARDEPNARLIVEGHTDTSGTNAHNRALSNDRACAVAAILAHDGIAERRIRAMGLGKRGLAVKTPDQVREPRNRRVVIRLIHRRDDDGLR